MRLEFGMLRNFQCEKYVNIINSKFINSTYNRYKRIQFQIRSKKYVKILLNFIAINLIKWNNWCFSHIFMRSVIWICSFVTMSLVCGNPAMVTIHERLSIGTTTIQIFKQSFDASHFDIQLKYKLSLKLITSHHK